MMAAISLLLESKGAGIDVDEAVGRTVVPAATWYGFVVDDAVNGMHVLKVAPFGDRNAFAVLRATGHQPATGPVQPTFLTAHFADAGAAGFRQIDGFLDAGGGFGRRGAIPVQVRRPILFLDLSEPEGAAVGLDRRADPSAGALQQIAPALAASGKATPRWSDSGWKRSG